jgi:hypothetical protein
VSSKFSVAEIDGWCEICPYAEVGFLINSVFDQVVLDELLRYLGAPGEVSGSRGVGDQ